jgi:hypothetical protein
MTRNAILSLTVLLLVGVSGERAHALTMQDWSYGRKLVTA